MQGLYNAAQAAVAEWLGRVLASPVTPVRIRSAAFRRAPVRELWLDDVNRRRILGGSIVGRPSRRTHRPEAVSSQLPGSHPSQDS